MKDKINILVVDDRANNRQALEALLEPVQENIVSLDSGEAALRFLLNGEAAVILLDVDMPGMDGFETARMIRSREKTRSLPIVFVTALDADGGQALRGYDLGAVDYLVKPIVPEVLLAKVAVFVELFHHHRARMQTVTNELESERTMTAAWKSQERNSSPFSGIWDAGLQRTLEDQYRVILKQRLEDGTTGDDGERRRRPKALADRIGQAGGGPRELLAVYRKVSDGIMSNALPRQARALRDQCRILTLELMGHLVEHYRQQVPRRPVQRPEERQGRSVDRRSL